ncbi:hypothetical protein RB596_009510 [Gaeumannomyces avenae]
MRLSITLVLPSLLALAGAVPGPKGGDDSGKSGTSGDDGGRGGGSGKCPEVWGAVKAELNQKFMTGTECNGLARAAIRAIFHDCGSWDQSQGLVGGCDGSLVTGVTPDVELDRPENRGLQTIAAYLKDAATRHGTSVADMIVFAGNAATVLCPGGPRVKTFIGRKDSTNSAKPGGLPDVFDTAANLVDLFAKKGYSQAELAALMGAHSTSTQRFVDPSQAGKAQDSTPGQWDVKYYKETIDYAKTGKTPNNVFVFPSDAKLATYQDVGKKFEGFVNNQNKWSSAFGKRHGEDGPFRQRQEQHGRLHQRSGLRTRRRTVLAVDWGDQRFPGVLGSTCRRCNRTCRSGRGHNPRFHNILRPSAVSRQPGHSCYALKSSTNAAGTPPEGPAAAYHWCFGNGLIPCRRPRLQWRLTNMEPKALWMSAVPRIPSRDLLL